MPRLVRLIAALAALAGAAGPAAGQGGGFVDLGQHPDAALQASETGRSLTALFPWKGRLYIGYGDWNNNTGPIWIGFWDPAAGAFQRAWLAQTEAVYNFRAIGGRLFAPATDPRGGGAEPDFAVGEPWSERRVAGAWHAFDLVTLTGDDLWLIGQQASDAVAWRSVDGGATFTEAQRIPRVSNGLNRFFFGGVYGGRLYLEAWRFGSVSTSSLVFDGTSFSAGPRLLPDAAAQGWRPVTFAGRLVYRARIPDNDGALLAFDGQAVSVVLATPIHDVAVHGPDLFALAADGTVLHTVDLATWTPFATAPAGSRSIAVFEGRLHVGTLDSRLYRGPQVVPAARLAVAAGPGGGPAVRVLDPVGGAGAASFLAYDPAFAGGVFVAAGNLDGIGPHEVVTGPGPGGAPHVRTFTADGGSLGPGFLAYDPAFRGGVHVAACDVDGDGRAEVVTAPGPGGAPRVRVFAVSGGPALPITEFLAYDPGFAGGVFVACGDLDGDGRAEIVTAPGAGGAPHVRVWKVAPGPVREVASLFPYDLGLAGGVRVAMGDVDGDLVPELVTVAGPGGATHVRVWRLGPGAAPAEIAGFFAYDPGFTGGASLAVGDVNGDGRAEIAVGAGPGGGPDVRVFTGAGALASSLFAFDPAFRGGVEVAILP